MPTVAFYTLGCKVNQYDTETLASLFREEGFTVVSPDEQADVYVVNTCTVTGEGDQKSRHAVHRFHRLHPEALLAVTGCYAQVSPQEVMGLEGVGIVAGTGRRQELARTAASILAGKQTAPVNLVAPHPRGESFEETGVMSVPRRARAMVKVQEGCNQFCTYCRVPLARGRERSRQPESVLAEVRALAEQGFQEIALTGIHLGAYGRDFEDGEKWDLARLAKAVAEVEGMFRIRLSSVEPTDVTPALVQTVAENPRLCPHFHVPLQSGDDEVLHRMGRHYDTALFARAVECIRARLPEAGVTTDIMVGFPGETEEAFARTEAFARRMAFTRIHVFPYSRRVGTPAADFPGQVPREVKEERSRRLIQAGLELSEKFHRRFVGRRLEVLFERKSRGRHWAGWSQNYIPVRVDREEAAAASPGGRILPVLVVSAGAEGVTGRIEKGAFGNKMSDKQEFFEQRRNNRRQ